MTKALDCLPVIIVPQEKGEPMSLIIKEALLAEYDQLHVEEPGRARKMIEDVPPAQPE